MPNNANFLLQSLGMSLPTLLAAAIGLVMASIFRQRATSAASTAMWSLIVMLLNTIVGVFVTALMPMFAGAGGENTREIYMAIGFVRQLINGAALIGLVFAVFQEREDESEKLPDRDEWSDRR